MTYVPDVAVRTVRRVRFRNTPGQTNLAVPCKQADRFCGPWPHMSVWNVTTGNPTCRFRGFTIFYMPPFRWLTPGVCVCVPERSDCRGPVTQRCKCGHRRSATLPATEHSNWNIATYAHVSPSADLDHHIYNR